MLLVVPTSAAHSRGLPVEAVDEHHLIERAALLALIMMGEGFVGIFGGLSVIGLLGMREPKGKLFALRLGTVVLVGIGAFVTWNVRWVSAQEFVYFIAALAVIHTVIDELIQPSTWVVGHGDMIDDDPLNISRVEAVPHPQ
ncbi:MAG: hypothetical protein WCJ88_08970 [Actinomycetes bacterium]